MLMTHIVAGYPDIETSEELVQMMADTGVTYIEIQIPFSDPIADGPTIMQANQTSLRNGTTTKDCFQLMSRLTKKIKTPLLFMTYFNIVHAQGVENFCCRVHEAGAWGLIVPDIPFDEEAEEHFLRNCKKYNLHAIQVISPLTTDERLKKIAKVASGFVYCVSRLGTTGERKALDPALGSYLTRVRKYIKLPLALGFGISSRAHVEAALTHADIAVMGSKVINLMNETSKGKQIETVQKFLKTIL
ncbi:tryptophan synthase subunit alpha [Candidatus Gracilibacteria bacterium]|nr:tryptophan synthase subunit alpha [Candidatus Gracilibacteria bacterium]